MSLDTGSTGEPAPLPGLATHVYYSAEWDGCKETESVGRTSYDIKKRKHCNHNVSDRMMQEKRLELSWYCYHTDLNRARLPIPPFLRTNVILTPFRNNVNTILEIFCKNEGRKFNVKFEKCIDFL